VQTDGASIGWERAVEGGHQIQKENKEFRKKGKIDSNLLDSLLLIFICFSSSNCRRRSVDVYIRTTSCASHEKQETFCSLNSRILCVGVLLSCRCQLLIPEKTVKY
jgi:hypothetical protein